MSRRIRRHRSLPDRTPPGGGSALGEAEGTRGGQHHPVPAAEPGEIPGPAGAGQRALGDLVLCGTVIAREAAEQGKNATAHWAHMLVHGALHLLGFDHETEAQASRMESLEIRILGGRGLPDPYAAR